MQTLLFGQGLGFDGVASSSPVHAAPFAAGGDSTLGAELVVGVRRPRAHFSRLCHRFCCLIFAVCTVFLSPLFPYLVFFSDFFYSSPFPLIILFLVVLLLFLRFFHKEILMRVSWFKGACVFMTCVHPELSRPNEFPVLLFCYLLRLFWRDFQGAKHCLYSCKALVL